MRTAHGAGWMKIAVVAMVGCLTAASSAIAAPATATGRSVAHAPQPMAAPESGAPIRVWSQFDGVAHKVAWSRFENGRWSAPRIVTFGPGDDLAPVIGASSAGSFLYWTDGRGRILYAPFDPESGRLFAAPRTLPWHGSSGGPSAEGGTDAPIILGLCDGTDDVCVRHPPTPPPLTSQPDAPSPEGGTDAPIVLGTGGGDDGSGGDAMTLTATSALSCSTHVLAVAYGSNVQAFAIDGRGRVTLLGRFVLAPGIDPGDATAAVATYFHPRACN